MGESPRSPGWCCPPSPIWSMHFRPVNCEIDHEVHIWRGPGTPTRPRATASGRIEKSFRRLRSGSGWLEGVNRAGLESWRRGVSAAAPRNGDSARYLDFSKHGHAQWMKVPDAFRNDASVQAGEILPDIPTTSWGAPGWHIMRLSSAITAEPWKLRSAPRPSRR